MSRHAQFWTAKHNGAVRRRQLLQRAALAGTGLSALGVACNAARNPARATSGASKQPKKGGTLNYAGGAAGSYDTQGRTFDPNNQVQFSAKSYKLFYERLLGYDLRTYNIGPELAQRWEQPSQSEYVFHLQPGVKWQNKPPVNGRPLSAEDIVFSLNRARTDDPRFFSRSLLAQIDRIEAPDEATVRITTKEADASALLGLAADNVAVVAREALDKYPKPTTADSAIGTGAFIMTAVEEKVSAEYTRNPEYWKSGIPYLDGIRSRYFADAETAHAAFLAGQVDVTLLNGGDAKKYISTQSAGYSPDWYADDTVIMACPNTKMKPLDDPRVTRALRLLMDHDELISAWAEAFWGRGDYGSIFPAALAAWDLTQDEYRSRLEWKQPKDDAAKEAAALLSAAGYSKDNPVRFPLLLNGSLSSDATIGPLLQAQWKRFSQGSVDVRLQPQDATTLNTTKANRSFAYGHLGGTAGMVDPDIWLTSWYQTDGSLNFMGYSDTQLDAMINKQRAIFDDKQRKAAVKEIVLYLIDHGPSTISANRYFLQAVKPTVQGHIPENSLNGRQYQSVWLDQ
jgi:peptide/nickel transport system substrate-binding protein